MAEEKDRLWFMTPEEIKETIDKTNTIIKLIDTIANHQEEKAAIICFLTSSYEKHYGTINQKTKEIIKEFINKK
jgi:hypothetical protein